VVSSPAAEPSPRGSRTTATSSGLGAITLATLVSGLIGYLILALAPRMLQDPAEYVQFTNVWSGLYLAVAALSGLQQEIARAASPRRASDHASSVLPLLAPIAAGTAFLVLATSPLWAKAVAPRQTWMVVIAIAAALVGYIGVAAVSGLCYGLRLWRSVAAMTITDAALRLVLVCGTLLLWPQPAALSWAIALPFSLAVTIVWFTTRHQVGGRYGLDVSRRRLVANLGKTLVASVSLGVLTSGFPLLVGVVPKTESMATVGPLISVIIITRAPLVIPILSLQGWMTVHFRDSHVQAWRRLWLILASIVAITAVAALAAYLIEPWFLRALWGPTYGMDGGICATIVIGAGLMGCLGVTGPATLAAQHHQAYWWGWFVGALLAILMLAIPIPIVSRTLAALVISPLVGMSIHLGGLASRRHVVYTGGS